MKTATRLTVIEGASHEFFMDAESQDYIDLLVNEIGTTVKIEKFNAKTDAIEEGTVTPTCIQGDQEVDGALSQFVTGYLSLALVSSVLLLIQ